MGANPERLWDDISEIWELVCPSICHLSALVPQALPAGSQDHVTSQELSSITIGADQAGVSTSFPLSLRLSSNPRVEMDQNGNA